MEKKFYVSYLLVFTLYMLIVVVFCVVKVRLIFYSAIFFLDKMNELCCITSFSSC